MLNRFSYIILIFGCCLFSQGRVDGVVAIVGKNIVLHSDLLQQSQIIAAEQGVDPSKRPYLFENIYLKTLENMINQYVVLGAAEKDTNLIISDDEVNRALDLRIEEFILQAGSKEAFENMVGMSLRKIKLEYWQEIRNMMHIERYKYSIIQSIDVSRPEVSNYYKSYKDSLPTMPEQYSYSVIDVPFVPGQSSENIVINFLDSLRGVIISDENSFESFAQKYSEDPGTAPSGGYLGFTSRGVLVSQYEMAAFALGVGDISFPVRTEFGYHLIRLIDRLGEKISTQHILRRVSLSKEDQEIAFQLADSIYLTSYQNYFTFDSLAVLYSNKYNNFSGTYNSVMLSEIPDVLFGEIKLLNLNQLSRPIFYGEGYLLVYLYGYKKEYFPDLINDWGLIYGLAKQEKQGRIFNNYIEKIKGETFIEVFNNN